MTTTACDDQFAPDPSSRETAIDAMAMEVQPHEWRQGGAMRYRGHLITRGEYVQRRAELINKPSWDDAPEWAQWLAQDEDGEWCFYPEKPEQSGTMWINDEPKNGIWVDVHCSGRIPAGHDWRDTLEQRPDTPKTWWTTATCTLCGHTTTAKVGDDMPVCPACMVKYRSDEKPRAVCTDGSPCGEPANPDDDAYCLNCPSYVEAAHPEAMSRSKYHREVKPGVWIDVYDVLQAWGVKNPALQHLIKKALAPGQRGHKDLMTDMDDIVASAKRARELEE